jgi:hypothetical protein
MMIKSRKMKWVGHAAIIQDQRSTSVTLKLTYVKTYACETSLEIAFHSLSYKPEMSLLSQSEPNICIPLLTGPY